jgi:hypothetical protein
MTESINAIIDEMEKELEDCIIKLDDLDSCTVRTVAAEASKIGAVLNTVQYRLRFLREHGVGTSEAAE